MGNHFIPQAYLKRFSSGDNLIWAHPRDREPFQAGIRVIAQENDLYSDEVEKYFNEEIEKPCLPVFAKIDSKTPLNAFDRAHLTNYVIALMLRKPADRERTKEWTKQNAGRLYKETEKEFNERIVNGDPDSDKMRNNLEEMKQIPNFGLNPIELWESMFDKRNFERTKTVMKS